MEGVRGVSFSGLWFLIEEGWGHEIYLSGSS